MQHGDGLLAGRLVQGARVLRWELVQQLGGAGVADQLVRVTRVANYIIMVNVVIPYESYPVNY